MFFGLLGHLDQCNEASSTYGKAKNADATRDLYVLKWQMRNAHLFLYWLRSADYVIKMWPLDALTSSKVVMQPFVHKAGGPELLSRQPRKHWRGQLSP